MGEPKKRPPADKAEGKTEPQKACSVDYSLAASELQKGLQTVRHHESMNRTAFEVARHVVTITDRYSLKTWDDSLVTAVMEFGESRNFEPELFFEEVFLCVGSVRVGAGQSITDRLAAVSAQARQHGCPEITGHFPTDRYRRECEIVLSVCRDLAGEGETFFMPSRTLGTVMNVDFHRASRYLSSLVDNEYLVKVGTHTKRRAQRFRLSEKAILTPNGQKEIPHVES